MPPRAPWWLPLACATLAAVVACGRGAPPRTAPDEPDPLAGEGPALTRAVLEAHERMHVRFAATMDLEGAIAVSDLARVQADARTVAALDEPDALPTWRPYLEEVRVAARAIEGAPDPGVAARGLARLGRACARCHVAIDVHVTPRGAPKPDAGPALAATMATHHWGAARMWEGLVGPADERWREGARALEGAPLTITAEARTPGHDLGIADDVARLRLLARRALTTDALDARADLYGELLGACIRCHATVRDR